MSVGTLHPFTLAVDAQPLAPDLANAFRDPDGDPLTYAAESSAPAVTTAALSGSTLTVAPVAPVTATVSVTAPTPEAAPTPPPTRPSR